jgi:hypothetical protein
LLLILVLEARIFRWEWVREPGTGARAIGATIGLALNRLSVLAVLVSGEIYALLGAADPKGKDASWPFASIAMSMTAATMVGVFGNLFALPAQKELAGSNDSSLGDTS